MPKSKLTVADTLYAKQLYLEKGIPLREIADRFNVSRPTVGEALRRQGLTLRKKTVTPNLFEVTEGVLEVLDGLLLGDGCLHIQRPRGRTPWYVMRQSKAQRPWVDSVRETFCQVGIECSLREVTVNVGLPGALESCSEVVVLQTKCYRDFGPVYSRWYPSHTKRVPTGLKITDRVLAHWFWGDGTFTRRKNGQQLLGFCTHGFTFEEVGLLSDILLSTYGWHCRVNRCKRLQKDGRVVFQPVLRLNRQAEVKELLSVVRPYEPGCFQYKLGVGDPPSRRRRKHERCKEE